MDSFLSNLLVINKSGVLEVVRRCIARARERGLDDKDFQEVTEMLDAARGCNPLLAEVLIEEILNICTASCAGRPYLFDIEASMFDRDCEEVLAGNQHVLN